MQAVKPLSDATFDTEVRRLGLVLVDFGAQWCSAYKALEPVVDAFASEHKDSLKVFSLDVDANPKSSDAFGVRGLPTLLLFRDGILVDHLVGYQSPARLLSALDRHRARP